MRVRYTLRARADLEEIYEYIEKHQPTAAQRLKSAIERQIGWLIHFPYMAPTTDEAGVRELTLTRHPYKIYYEVAGDEVRVLHIRHAQRRPRRRRR
jgi:plasmid stabilization system protein ParE